MNELGALLVHGYLGSPEELAPLARCLAGQLGASAVSSLRLPGHLEGRVPSFDTSAFLDAVGEALGRTCSASRRALVIGHSTGGSLLLKAIERTGLLPDLLVLAGTPPVIDVSYGARWQRSAGGRGVPLDEVGALVSLVNDLARRGRPIRCPVLVIHGTEDALVPASEAERWRSRCAAGVRVARVMGAGHDLFLGRASHRAVDIVARAARDAGSEPPDGEAERALRAMVPESEKLFESWPASLRHLAESPAGCALRGRPFACHPSSATEPTLANIEITTRCNMACGHCARTFLRLREGRDMERGVFQRVLEQLPHAFRVTLVGLGEPLLHPGVVDLVARAAREGRRVGLVTNGMALDRGLARDLCRAGLASLTFSLDSARPERAAALRPGSDLARIAANIRTFLEERERAPFGRVGASVFCALSGSAPEELGAIVELAIELGLDALTVTDLNYPENQERSLHRALTPQISRSLDRELRRALSRGLPVFPVHAIEALAVERRFRELVVLRGEVIAGRQPCHSHCHSPWQTIPVNVHGKVAMCDCQPAKVVGNILEDAFSLIWNGESMCDHRARMLSDEPPYPCRMCPRF